MNVYLRLLQNMEINEKLLKKILVDSGIISSDTGYEITCDSTNGRITISAPDAQLGETISVTR